MDVIAFAIPVFLLFIVLETWLDWRRGGGFIRLEDAIGSLSAGMLSITTGILSRAIKLVTYILLWQTLRLFDLSAQAWWVWVLAFLGYDFCYYLLHRAGHRINVLWAAHVVHHQSEDYNLTTALRQTSTGFLFDWVFYLPLALLGIPPLVFFTVASINLLYQFWVHTRLVGQLGWLDRILVTPSNHRVHHAINERYIDKNFGGVFVIWDRLLGTFQPELASEPPVYGVRKPLRSWNPVRANLQHYVSLSRDFIQARRMWDKLRLWWMPTGWRPDDCVQAAPGEPFDLARFERYSTEMAPGLRRYVVGQFSLLIPATTWLMAVHHQHSLTFSALVTLWLGWSLHALTCLLESRPGAERSELGRLAMLPLVYAALVATGQLPMVAWLWLLLAAHGAGSVFMLLILTAPTTDRA